MFVDAVGVRGSCVVDRDTRITEPVKIDGRLDGGAYAPVIPSFIQQRSPRQERR